MRKTAVGLVVGVLALGLASPASAGPPSSPNCFGYAAAFLGQSGGMGEHSSSFAGSPRSGIGNVADDLTGTHQPGILGGVLLGLLTGGEVSCT